MSSLSISLLWIVWYFLLQSPETESFLFVDRMDRLTVSVGCRLQSGARRTPAVTRSPHECTTHFDEFLYESTKCKHSLKTPWSVTKIMRLSLWPIPFDLPTTCHLLAACEMKATSVSLGRVCKLKGAIIHTLLTSSANMQRRRELSTVMLQSSPDGAFSRARALLYATRTYSKFSSWADKGIADPRGRDHAL